MFILGHLVHLEELWVSFVYEGRLVKIKVTGGKGRKSLLPQCKTSIGHNFSVIEN